MRFGLDMNSDYTLGGSSPTFGDARASRKIALIKLTADGFQYALDSIRMPVLVERLCINRDCGLIDRHALRRID